MLTVTALTMSPLQTAIVLFPASLYGEGLRRAFLQLSPERPNRFTGWLGPPRAAARRRDRPVLVLALLAAGPVVAPLYVAGGSRLVLGVVIAFHVTFVLLWIALLLIYRLVGRPDRRRARWWRAASPPLRRRGLPAGVPAVPRDPRRLVAALRRPAGVRRRRRARPVALPHPRAGARRLPAHPDPRRPVAADARPPDRTAGPCGRAQPVGRAHLVGRAHPRGPCTPAQAGAARAACARARRGVHERDGVTSWAAPGGRRGCRRPRPAARPSARAAPSWCPSSSASPTRR